MVETFTGSCVLRVSVLIAGLWKVASTLIFACLFSIWRELELYIKNYTVWLLGGGLHISASSNGSFRGLYVPHPVLWQPRVHAVRGHVQRRNCQSNHEERDRGGHWRVGPLPVLAPVLAVGPKLDRNGRCSFALWHHLFWASRWVSAKEVRCER